MPDFGYENVDNVGNDTNVDTSHSDDNQDITNLETEEKENKDGSKNLNDVDTGTDTEKHDNDNADDDKKDKIELKAGEVVAIGDVNYTVAENGDLVDEKGNVFKEAKDVQAYLATLEADNEEGNHTTGEKSLTLQTIKDTLGFEIVDEDDKPVEYEDSPAGIASYVEDVISHKTNEIQEATLNTLFSKYPFAKNIIDYYVANGGSLDGWGVKADRSGITIDDKNESQQEEIVRTAWREQKRTGDVESYIAYLKASGTLLSVAKTELAGLQAADKARDEELAKQAQAENDKAAAEQEAFWKGVSDTIKARKIAGYEIPEQIKISRNGKSLMVTPTDFYNYLAVVEKDGLTAYAKDCKAITPEQELNDNLLRAYLRFTGGDYSSLVDMAIKDKEVKTIRFKANTAKQPVRRFTPKGKEHNSGQSIDLGY